MYLVLYAKNLNYIKSGAVFFDELKKAIPQDSIQFINVSAVNPDEINKALKKVEIILFDFSIILAMSQIRISSKYFHLDNKKEQNFYINVWHNTSNSRKPIFLTAFSSDLHANNFGLERDLYIDILRGCTAICWPYSRFPFDIEKDLNKYNSTFLRDSNLSGTQIFNTWKEIVNTIPINIDLPHSLGSSEIREKTSYKKWEYVVPGAAYVTRKIALESGKSVQLKIAEYKKMYRWLVNAPYHLYSNIFPKRLKTSLYLHASSTLFSYLISRSEISFACGGELKYFVRKFLEIPAQQTVMVAIPTNNFHDYGFTDGEHYLATEPEEAGTKAKFLLQNPGVKEKIRKNALQLVKDKHTAKARVNNVLQCIEAFSKGKLKKASFVNGNFEIY